MRPRRGVTLLEMLVVMGTMSVVMTLSVTTIMFLMRAEGDGAASLQASLAVSRLANDFRRDVHSAGNARLDDETQSIRLVVSKKQSVTYQAEGSRVTRLVWGTGDNGAETKQAQEAYELPDGELRFALVADPTPDAASRVAIEFRQFMSSKEQSTHAAAPSRDYRIEAAVSRDHRFDKAK